MIRIILSPEDAEEVMQDSFIKIFSNLNKFNCEDDDAAFRAWMKQISVRTAIDSLRKKESLPEMFNEFDFDVLKDDEEPDYESLYTVDQIKESVMRLSDSYRVILSLYLFDGYDTEEIAEILNLKSASVRTQYMRGKKRLQEILLSTKNKTDEKRFAKTIY